MNMQIAVAYEVMGVLTGSIAVQSRGVIVSLMGWIKADTAAIVDGFVSLMQSRR